MTDIVRASRGELTATEIFDIVDAGGRVIIEVPVLGEIIENVAREQNGIYYCDTPTKLLTHKTGAEFRACLEQFELARITPTDDAPTRNVNV